MSTQKRKPLNVNQLTTELSDPEQIQQALSAKKQTAAAPAEAFIPATTAMEKKVAEIWARRLGLERVGLQDDFFKLGGHSLLATQVLAEVSRVFEVALPINLAFSAEFTVATVVKALTESASQPAAPRLQRTKNQASYPLSFGQQRLWWLQQLEPDNPAYNTLVTIRFTGSLQAAILEQSLNEVWQRHEGLRTVFVVEDEQPRQVIRPVSDFKLPRVDLRHLSEPERETEARRQAVQQTRDPFDLVRGPLLRVKLVRLKEAEHWLLVTIHHIIGDGWSAQVLMQEIAAAYQARLAGESSPLPELSIRYVDYTDWQREQLASRGGVLEDHFAYWQQRLANLPVLALPTDHPRPPRQTFRGQTHWIDIDSQLTEALRQVGQREGASLFMLLLAVFQVLLCRYTGQADIVVGTPVANRTQPELERLVGFFVNSLVLRNDLRGAGDPTFLEVLRRVRAGALEAYAHQDLPFEQLVERLRPERDLSRNPLFQVLIALTPPDTSGIEFADFNFTEVDIDTGTAKFDLSLLFKETPQGVHGGFEYNADLFDAPTIARLAAHFERLLHGIVADPEQRLSRLPLLTDAEQQTLNAWNATEADYPREKCLQELFEAQVEQTPGAIAVVFEEQRVTYAELNQRANQLAHYLRSLGVAPEMLVGICLDRSVEMVVGLLGILKAGAAYVPLDPAYPAERLAYMLEDSQVTVLLTQSHLLHSLGTGGLGLGTRDSLTIICLDTHWESITGSQSPAPNPRPLVPDSLAYLIYTSGSTGQPKGAMNTHRGIVNRLTWMQTAYQLTPADRVLQKTPFSFDVSVWEFFWPLLTGASLVMARPEGHKDSAYLAQVIQTEGITTIHFVPSMLGAFLEEESSAACTSLRRVICSGEALSGELVERFYKTMKDRSARPRTKDQGPRTKDKESNTNSQPPTTNSQPPAPELYNLYGPTEAAVDVTHWTCQPQRASGTIPIGRPIAKIQIHILDNQLQPVPVGVTGELYIGGVGVGRGYWGRPELTAERFIPNPFAEMQAKGQGQRAKDQVALSLGLEPWALRLYKTGDLARYLPDGNIEFLGRRDHQVKLRGFRIELEEIESALMQYPGINAAVVVMREDGAGQRLVAYLVSQTPPASTELRHFLKNRLPDYMIPSDFVCLDTLPLTPNGKVDRRALARSVSEVEGLPAPKSDRSTFEAAFVAPRTPLEELLAGIWTEVLHLERVGVHDNFFELGGHSLLATQVVSRMRKALQIDLPLRTIFEANTIEALAQEIERLRRGVSGMSESVIPVIAREEILPLSFAQERLWFLDQLEPGGATYNMPAAIRLTGQLEIAVLERSLNGVLQRQESLRTTIKMEEGKPRLAIAPHLSLKLAVTDLSQLSEHMRNAEVQALIHTEARRPFDLANGPLCRAHLLRLAATEHLLLLTLHHIISDGWSLNVLIQEVTNLYAAELAGQPADLPSLPIQYADFAAWQRDAAQSAVIETQLSFWKDYLAGAPTRLELPTDHSRPAAQSFRGATRIVTLPMSLSTALHNFSRKSDATLFMTLTAAFAVLLQRYTGQADFLLGTPIANRTRMELEGLIGFFANTLVLRMNLEGDPTFREFVQRVREKTLAAYAHQDVPFERLVEAIQPARDLSRSPLFQVMLVLQNAPQTAASLGLSTVEGLPGLTLQPLEVDSGTSKFDLTLTLTETPTGLQGALEYSTDLFEAATIERLWGHFQMLLQGGVVENPDQRISELPLLTDTEQQLLIAWNATQAAIPATQCLHHFIEAQAERTPEAVALVWPGTDGQPPSQLTYQALNGRANHLAHYLRSLGVGPETLVGLYLERGLDLIVGMLGILKAGGAYVPMDPAYPEERLAFILADARIEVVVTESRLLAASGWRLANPTADQLPVTICLDTDWKTIANYQSPAASRQPPATSLAYLIYTSGSTGRPKGVAITHQSAVVFVNWAQQVFSSEVLSGVLAATSVCFDLSVFELFVPLSVGGTVVLAENALELPALNGERLTLVNTVPSALTELLRQGGVPDSVRVINLAGEALRRSLVQQIYALPTIEQVFNLYGPSEDTTYSTFTLVNRDDPREPTIGRPIANTQAHILDTHLQPVPIGVIGELYLGGHGLARGYFDRPELTAERFVPNPFAGMKEKAQGARLKAQGHESLVLGPWPLALESLSLEPYALRLYRTGDLARYLPNGNIEFLGRRDHQVKVRGFRIELGEIEAALGQHPAVRDCVVIAREAEHSVGHRLVAYVVPVAAGGRRTDEVRSRQSEVLSQGQARLRTSDFGLADSPPSSVELRAFLKSQLPEYMVPALFMFLEALPLTPNGKVDRKALPAPDGARPDLEATYVAPRNPTEAALAQIWAEVLQLEQVGVHDNFFELGGDSILTIQIVMKAKQAGWQITPKQLFQHQTLAELAAAAEAAEPTQATPERSEPFALAGLEPEALVALRAAEPQLEDLYPLSPMQAGMLFHSLRAPESGVYFRQWRCTLNTALDVQVLRQAWQHAVRRHPILRTAFRWEQRATPAQAVYQDCPLPWDEHDWRADSPEVQTRRLADFLRADRERGFDLAVAPPMRITLIRMADESFHFIWSHHQILLDGWSIPLVLKEVFAGYERLSQGQTLSVEEGLPYREYLAWLQRQDLAQAERFWRKTLVGLVAPTPLGVDHVSTRPASLANSEQPYAEQYLVLPAALTAELQTWARQHQLTLNTLVQGAWSLLLSRYSGEEEVVFGVTTSGRPVELPQADAIVGLFVNTLPLRVSVEASTTLVPWLRTLQAQQAELRQYEYTPLVELQGWSDVPRHRPLFESILIFENTPQDAELRAQGTRLGIETVESAQQANYALTVMAFPGVELNLGIGYDAARFDHPTIERMLGHVQTLLSEMVSRPERGDHYLSELSLLTETERQQLLLDQRPAAPARPLLEMFAEQVARTPNEVAVIFAGECAEAWRQLTYAELDQRSNQLAQHLQTMGVGLEVRVGVCLERSLKTLVALLAIFKAGGVYVPLDPSYPSKHLAFIQADARIEVLITESRLLAASDWRLAAGNQPTTICLDAKWETSTTSSQQPAANNQPPTAASLAYIVYTSGSTGEPKGVAVPHQQLLNRFDWMWGDYPFAPNEVLCQRTTVNFSVSFWEFLGALLKGVPTVFVPDEVGKDAPRLIDALSQHNVTRIVVVPSLLRTILSAEQDLQRRLPKLKLWSVCGEPLSLELYQQFREQLPRAVLVNQYGASEANDVTHYDTRQYRSELASLPAGRPVTHTQVYLLDHHLQPVPVGVVGQVYVSSAGLARGYWERPDLTAERFVPNPFAEMQEKAQGARLKAQGHASLALESLSLESYALRLYYTGDLARYLPDGNIELVGRRDHQVKIRGMRVELRGVEKALRQHPAVAQAIVTAHEDHPGERRLVAYVVAPADQSLTLSDLREYLKEKLPDYMLPATFMFLDALPLTPNGKVDRRALPAPDHARPEIAETYVAPRTPLEVMLAQLWAEVLGVERVGIHDSFFELGGHSLMATQLITRLHDLLQGELPLAMLFDAPTVANLAAAITAQQTAPVEIVAPVPSNIITADPAQRHLPFPLTDIQQAYWIGRQAAFELGNVGTHIYVELESEQLDLERFTWAWNQMIARHEMLRAIVLSDGRQRILKDVPLYPIEILDLRGHPAPEAQAELEGVRERLAREALVPDRWPLFEIRATRLDERRLRIHLKLDLLVADAWSSILIAQELSQLYIQPDVSLPPLELSFRDYVLAEQALQADERYQRAQAYWWERLDSLPPAPDLPLAKDPRSVAQPRFVRRNGQLEKDAWGQLKARAQQAGLTPSGILLAAYAEALTLWSKSPRFTINLTLFNRLPLHPEVNQVIGDFTSLTLLAVDNASRDSFAVRARRLQEQLWQDLDHRAVSGVRVLRELFRREGGAPRAAMPVVFTSLLVQNLDRPDAPTAQRFDLPVEVVYSAGQTPQVWLDHQVDEANGTLVFTWDSVDELFPKGLIDALLESYCALLQRLAQDDSAWQATRVAALPPTQLEQRGAVNATSAPISPALLHTLFADQVSQRPDQPAVITSGQTLSYQELAQRSAHLGHQLREWGARPNTLIAVVMQKGWEQVVGVLGILQAGAAYLPLSADLPPERLWHLLEHGQVEIVLTQSWLDSTLTWPDGIRRLSVDTDWESITNRQPPAPQPLAPDSLAYVIYTSGSTGLPKGVMIDHRGAVNTIVDLNQRFHIGPEDRVLALSSLSFDLSVYDIFGTLAAGGAIVMPDASSTRDPAHWAKLVTQHQVTVWNSVPALMELFVEYAARHPELSPRSLRLVWMSGDWIPITLPDQIRSLLPEAEIISMGGATEASIWSILYPIGHVDPDWKSIPYGQPMVNQTFHVLNDALEPCPVWVPGELYIGGVGVAQGYWRDEEKTKERFISRAQGARPKVQGPDPLGLVPEPLSLEPYALRLYRTGDLGRYLPDGNIEFLGREDFQVKIQGYRIELGEIETALNQHPAVRLAAVIALGEARGPKRLAAYVVPNDAPPTVNELRQHLSEKLPAYMIPATYRFLDNLPLSANGKVDRHALSAVEESDPKELSQASTLELPSALPPSAAAIAQLVADVVGLDSLDPYASLLDLGANSVDMIRVANRLEQDLGFRPAIDEFYLSPTVLGLARAYEQHLERQPESVGQDAPPVTSLSTPPLASFKLLVDPDERAAFKSQQRGVRPDGDGQTLVQLDWSESEAQLKKYLERRTRRQFALQPIAFNQFSEFLGVLRQITVAGRPKYRYGSAGGLYPVQTYVHLKPGSVEQLLGGTYYYHPVDHRLVLLNPGAELKRDIHVPFINQPVFDEATFSIFLVVQLAAIAPIYGERSMHFAAIEAGLMTQLLETSAVEQQIGLCQIGDVNFEPIRCLFDLEPSHALVHSLLGGRVDAAEDENPASLSGSAQQTSHPADRMLEKILQLSPEEVEALLEANEIDSP